MSEPPQTPLGACVPASLAARGGEAAFRAGNTAPLAPHFQHVIMQERKRGLSPAGHTPTARVAALAAAAAAALAGGTGGTAGLLTPYFRLCARGSLPAVLRAPVRC